MATLTYLPIDPSLLITGATITTSASGSVSGGLQAAGGNDRWINTTFAPPLFCSQIGIGSPGPTPGAWTNASSGSPEVLARWLVRGNATRRAIVVSCWASVSAGSTTGTLTVEHGGATATATVTSTTAVAVDITITPVSGSSPLELKISGHTNNSNSVSLMCASARMAEAGSSSGGIGADGYAPLGDWTFGTSYQSDSPMYAGKPVSTELMSRGYNNMRALARDRIACVATLQRPAYLGASRNDFTTESSQFQTVGFFHVPQIDKVERAGVISVYVSASGSAKAQAGIFIDGSQSYFTTTSAGTSGWAHHTVSIPSDGCNVSFAVRRNSGSGYAGILAAQLWRAY